MFVRSPSRPSPFPFSSVPVPLLVRPRSPSRPSPFPFSSVPVPFSSVPLSSVPFSSVPFSSVSVPFSPAPALPPIYIRSPIGVAKRRSHPQTATLRPIQSSPPPLFPSSPSLFPALGVAKRRRHHQTATLRARQHSQTRVASPDGYAYGTSAQPNGEDIDKRLRSEPLSADKQEQHHHLSTLTAPQHSQTEKASPNSYAQNPST